jgi:hypothetical protein
MSRYSQFIFGTLTLLALASCKTISSKPIFIQDTPVTYQKISDMVDEETIDYSVKFRNTGSQIISFDYTLTDSPTVPHTDAEGPNSGLIENLYPGAEASVKNPIKDSKNTFIALGKVTYGRRSSDQLAKQYKPSYVAPSVSAAAAGSAAILPPLEPLPAP